jgi:hypothetical protein
MDWVTWVEFVEFVELVESESQPTFEESERNPATLLGPVGMLSPVAVTDSGIKGFAIGSFI